MLEYEIYCKEISSVNRTGQKRIVTEKPLLKSGSRKKRIAKKCPRDKRSAPELPSTYFQHRKVDRKDQENKDRTYNISSDIKVKQDL